LSSDVYAYGLLFWEICMRQIPFSEVPQLKIPEHVMSGKRPIITSDRIPSSMKTIIVRCWDSEYTRRPTLSQVHQHLLDVQASMSSLSVMSQKNLQESLFSQKSE